MSQQELILKASSQPVAGAPYSDAIWVRDSIIEDRKEPESKWKLGLGEEGSRARQGYMVRKRIYFDPRMVKFWRQVRKNGPTKEFLAYLDEREEAEEAAFGSGLRSRQRLHEEPVEYALDCLANTIVVLSYPSHSYLSTDIKSQKRDVERVINSLRSTSHVLKSIPHFDVPVLAHIQTRYMREYLYEILERHEDYLLAVFNPGLAAQLEQIDRTKPTYSPREDEEAWWEQSEKASDSHVRCFEGNLDDSEIVEQLEDIADSFAENLHRDSQRAYDFRKRGERDEPESLSNLLNNLADNLSAYSDGLHSNPFNPRPNEPNAYLREFCRRLDAFLRNSFNVSSPSQVANFANVVFDVDVDATDVKRWRIKK